MDLDKVRELIAFAQQHDLIELEIREGDQTIRFRRAVAAAAPGIEPALPVGATLTVAPALAGFVLKAPMTGTFYRAPAPGARAFVEPGSHVEVTTVVGIIESMKMMNPVEAGCVGTVSALLVANSERVQIGQPLLTIL